MISRIVPFIKKVTFYSVIIAIVIFFSLSRSEKVTKIQWFLLNAPYLMNEDDPGTGVPYLRAPLVDWHHLGEYASFQECAAAIHSPQTDPNNDLHKSGKLSIAERALGFACVKSTDERLYSQKPYDFMAAAKESE